MTSTACGGVITNWNQCMVQKCCLIPEQNCQSVNPNSLAVVMKEIKDAAIANGTFEPTLDETKAEYQCQLALRYAAGLRLPPFTIGVTSSIILHALNVSGPSQLTEASDYLSAGIANVVTRHSG